MNKRAVIMAKLFASYPNVNVNEMTVAVYDEMLADISDNDLSSVIQQCLAECKFLPTIAEIRERHRTITRKLAVPSWEEAWELLQRAIREVGGTQRPVFKSNPYLERAVGIIGWKELCYSTTMSITRAQFRDVYNNLLKQADEIDRLLPASRQMAEQHGQIRPIIRSLLESAEISEDNEEPTDENS